MPIMPRIATLWRNLLRKDRAEQDLTEEVQAYLELLIESKIKQGLRPEEARRAALMEMGGVEQVKERVREDEAPRSKLRGIARLLNAQNSLSC